MQTINDSTSNDKEEEEEDTSKEGNPTLTTMKKEGGRRDEMNIKNEMKDEWIIEFIDEEREGEDYGEMDIRIVFNGFLFKRIRDKVDTILINFFKFRRVV